MSLILEFLKKASSVIPRANKIYKEHFSDDEEKLGTTSGGDFQTAPKIFGSFEEVGENPFVKQEGKSSCAVKSQQLILEKFGIEIPESELATEAEAHGWFDPIEGTSPQDVGKLLENHGIEVNRFTDANVFTLQNELCQGHQVIVSVDSDELWYGLDRQDAADHALIVSNIDTTDVTNPKVVLTDPGTGYVQSYPWNHFADAWEDGNCFMVSTKNAPPVEFAPEMCNFDYAAGTFPDFDGFSYSDFLAQHGNAISGPDAPNTDSFYSAERFSELSGNSNIAMVDDIGNSDVLADSDISTFGDADFNFEI